MAGRPRKESVEEEEKEITDIADQIEEGFPEEGENKVVELVSTGCDIMDLILGGGVPFGKMLNIIGDSSTGKSFFVSEIIASARKIYGKKLKHVYLDCEAGYSFDSNAIWGFEMVSPDNPQVETVEQFAIEIDKALDSLKKDEKLIYVIDSYDALSSEVEAEEYDKKLDQIEKGKKVDGSYGMAKAKFINSFFRQMIRKIKEKDCLFIVVNQTRDNINGGLYAPKKKRNGGEALNFYSSQIIWLKVKEKFGREGRETGIAVEVENKKNKIGRPFRKGIVDVIYDYGCDNLSTNIKFLYDLHTPEGKVKGKVFGKDDDSGKKTNPIELDWDGEKFTFRQLVQHIEKNNLERQVTRKVREKWEELETNEDYVERKRRY